MSKKLERIEADLQKARAKRAAWDQRIRELEERYTEEENTEIHEVVRAFKLTPEQLQVLLQSQRGKVPGDLPDAIEQPGEVSETNEQEVEHEEN